MTALRNTMTRARSRDETPVDRMKAAMKAAGIRNPTELARRVGLPRQTIHRWFSDGIDNINYRNLLNVSDALNVNARWLMFGEVGPLKQPFDNPRETEASAIARDLAPKPLEAWLTLGRTLLEMQNGRAKQRGR